MEDFENKEDMILDSDLMEKKEVPSLYNPKFILFYGILFSVIAGGILMGMNFKRLGQKRRAWFIVAFALIYTAFQLTILNLISVKNTALTFILSYLGMYLIEQFFWKKYVPGDLEYNKRKVWWPLIIALIFTIPIGVLMIMAMRY